MFVPVVVIINQKKKHGNFNVVLLPYRAGCCKIIILGTNFHVKKNVACSSSLIAPPTVGEAEF